MTVLDEVRPGIDFAAQLQYYYSSVESRIGYQLFLGGTRHFGYYTPGTRWPFPITKALRKMEDHLYDVLALPAGSKVLDAGCGAGFVATHMVQKGLLIQGIDIVPKHVQWAQELFRHNGIEKKASAREMDYHDLSAFQDQSFDGLYTMETFVHATDIDKALSEFFRVLKPGGRIAMNEYEHMDLDDAIKILPYHSKHLIDGFKRMNRSAALPANEVFVEGYLKKRLQKHGFEDVTVLDLTENVKPMVRLFYLVALIPWFFICLFGLQDWFVNTGAGYVGYPLLRKRIQTYKSLAATKPL